MSIELPMEAADLPEDLRLPNGARRLFVKVTRERLAVNGRALGYGESQMVPRTLLADPPMFAALLQDTINRLIDKMYGVVR